jgi:hypothetical protein
MILELLAGARRSGVTYVLATYLAAGTEAVAAVPDLLDKPQT